MGTKKRKTTSEKITEMKDKIRFWRDVSSSVPLTPEHPLDEMRCTIIEKCDEVRAMLDEVISLLHDSVMVDLIYYGLDDDALLQMVKDMQELTENCNIVDEALYELSEIAGNQLIIPYEQRHKTA